MELVDQKVHTVQSLKIAKLSFKNNTVIQATSTKCILCLIQNTLIMMHREGANVQALCFKDFPWRETRLRDI